MPDLKSKVQFLGYRLRRKTRSAWNWIRFGDITERVVGTAGDGVVAEVEYRGRRGTVVGYWAYGGFDPAFPYRG